MGALSARNDELSQALHDLAGIQGRHDGDYRELLERLFPVQPAPSGECLLEWAEAKCEGTCVPQGHVYFFQPDGDAALPLPGTEMRVRFDGGSLRAIMLSESERLFARAPHRQERRMFPRSKSGGFALLKVGTKSAEASIKDISEGGIALEGTFLLEAGEHLEILLRLEGKKTLTFECEGLVVNCKKPTTTDAPMNCWLGVQFTQIPESLRSEIRRLVREEPK